MAERRMFAKTIIDSDAFLEMPLSTQCLYFHLSMRADDEGFINNPKKIQRMIGASDDDIRLLITKKFIIPFESGIVVIKHWKIHNYIRGDRIVETKYKEEKEMLTLKENGAYSLNEEIKQIENLSATDKRKQAYQNSTLPYSFTYKIKRAFEGHTCPVCGIRMTSAYKNAMPTIQHNIPISKGGVHEIENISVICESCNTSIKDKETDNLNNAEVITMWDKIVYADKHRINWFWNQKLLDEIVVSQMTDKCQSSDRQMSAQDSIGKDSIGKYRLDNNITADNSAEQPQPQKKKRFVKPSVEEIQSYCNEKGYVMDPQYFFDYYEAKGWLVGKTPMKDWKAAVRNWAKNEKEWKPKKEEKVFQSTGSTIEKKEVDPETWRMMREYGILED